MGAVGSGSLTAAAAAAADSFSANDWGAEGVVCAEETGCCPTSSGAGGNSGEAGAAVPAAGGMYEGGGWTGFAFRRRISVKEVPPSPGAPAGLIGGGCTLGSTRGLVTAGCGTGEGMAVAGLFSVTGGFEDGVADLGADRGRSARAPSYFSRNQMASR